MATKVWKIRTPVVPLDRKECRPSDIRASIRQTPLCKAVASWLAHAFASPRATTPPSSVSVRFDSSRRCLNCGAFHFQQAAEKTHFFESVSIWVKGG